MIKERLTKEDLKAVSSVGLWPVIQALSIGMHLIKTVGGDTEAKLTVDVYDKDGEYVESIESVVTDDSAASAVPFKKYMNYDTIEFPGEGPDNMKNDGKDVTVRVSIITND